MNGEQDRGKGRSAIGSSPIPSSARLPGGAQPNKLLDLPRQILAERFARSVAARSDELFIIRPDNSGHWEHWPTNGVPAVPFAVHLADVRGYRTLGFDFDGTRAGSDARETVALLQNARVRGVLTKSGPLDRWHVLATFAHPIPPATVARMVRTLKRRCTSLDDGKLRNPETGAIRPPFAPHRLGGRSEPIGDLAEALAALEAGNPPEAFRRLAEAVGVPLLTPRMEYLLLYGRGPRHYQSRSEVVMAIALAHANAGSTEEHLLDDLLDTSNAAGDKVQTMCGRDGCRYVHRCWLRACERVRRSPMIASRPDALSRLDQIREAIEAAPWPGRKGATRHAIMQAHLAIAQRAGAIEYDASVREVAERAGVHVLSVIRHHGPLIKARWLRRRGLRYPGQATHWRLIARSTGD